MIEERLRRLFERAASSVGPTLGLEPPFPDAEFKAPKLKEHGDFATNLALALGAASGAKPREVAERLVHALPQDDVVEKVEVAGPGFINLWVTDTWLHDALRAVVADGPAYGRPQPNDRRIQVEFVSSNPTGPLHIGHARNAALGDALARLFEFAGWRVEREFYFNDAGGQMDRFGASVEARYLQALGRQAEVPEDGYHGEYVKAYAQDIVREHGDALADLPPDERMVRLRQEGARRSLAAMEQTLSRFGVRFDSYVSESELAERGEIEGAIRRLREAGLVYDAEGAVWFRSTDFGDDKDRPLVRSAGTHTYFAADCGYLLDKFRRGFDRILYVWGADHHGDVVRVRGAATGLGLDADRVEIAIYQWVSFERAGEPLPMSKRAGTFVSLDELIDEVGADAARFHLLMFSSDHTMRFDLEEVARRSMDNPVYYVQYGHARISSILRTAASRGVELASIDEADLGLLTTDTETDLLRSIADVPAQIAEAAELRAPHRLTHLAQELASRFHRFYTECRVVSDDAALTQARLWLCAGTQRVLANLLGLLGVSAPEVMARTDG